MTAQQQLDDLTMYAAMEIAMVDYNERHNIVAEPVLTVLTDDHAHILASHLAPRLEGKTVVEVGCGIGLLALHLGQFAKRIYCIEANPVWAWTFVNRLLQVKPRNVSYLFGAADEFLGVIKGDVALYCTHSDIEGMSLVAAQFAPTVIDVWGELIEQFPDSFDPEARELRGGKPK